jgi:flagellar biogenesis protein FliO
MGMFQAHSAALLKGGKRAWLLPGVLFVLAVALGVVLPRFLPSSRPALKLAPAAQPAPTDKLAYEPPSWPEPPDPSAMLLRLAAGTAVVLVLCVATLWLLRRWLGGGTASAGDRGQLKLIEMLPVGPRRALALIKAGNHQVVIGIDHTGLKSALLLQEPFENALAAAQFHDGPKAASGRLMPRSAVA